MVNVVRRVALISFAARLTVRVSSATALPPEILPTGLRDCAASGDAAPAATDAGELWSQTAEWIERRFFPDAITEGWPPALPFFSEQDLRYQRLLVYSARCEECWIDLPPASYPNFETWLAAADEYTEPAETADDTDHFGGAR